MPTAIWAHRGASAYAPENTLEAIELALRMGADGIELDVHRTRDGKLVVIHDETVDRTSNGSGYVKDMTCAELKKLDFSNGFEKYRGARIPTLKEVYGMLRSTQALINVEIKCERVIYQGICDDLTKLAHEMGVSDRIIYSSFNHYMLMECRKAAPSARIGLLYGEALYNAWEYAHMLGADALHPPYTVALQAPGFIRNCRNARIAINTWTVDDEDAIRLLAASNVNAIITNKPDIAKKAIN